MRLGGSLALPISAGRHAVRSLKWR